MAALRRNSHAQRAEERRLPHFDEANENCYGLKATAARALENLPMAIQARLKLDSFNLIASFLAFYFIRERWVNLRLCNAIVI